MLEKTSYDLLEENIVQRLQPLINAGFEVWQTPETDEELNKKGIAFEVPRVTVMYLLSEFDDQPIKGHPKNYSIGIVKQHEFAEVTINLQARKLRGAKGLYSIYEDIRKLLLGFRPKGWSYIFFKNFMLVERNDESNVWYYALHIVCKREVFNCDDENLNLINSNNIGLLDVSPNEPDLVQIILNKTT